MRTTMAWLLALALPAGLLSGCGAAQEETVPAGTEIHLDDAGITVDGEAISTEKTAAVYTANDIVFYLEGQDFTYGEGTEDDAHAQAEADAHTVVHTSPSRAPISWTAPCPPGRSPWTWARMRRRTRRRW